MRFPKKPPANPGLNATVTLWDTGAMEREPKGDSQRIELGRLTMFADQIVTINHSWYAPGSTQKRQASTTATVANTFKDVILPMYPGRNLIELVTTTAPTVWEVGFELSDVPPPRS
jgi:hypothetical protein